MSYDLVLDEIGEFGLWQAYVFFLAGISAAGGALITYSYSFVGYVPEEFRCYLPACDADKYSYSDNDFAAYDFALLSNDSYVDRCNSRLYIGPDQGKHCEEQYFDQDRIESCSEFTYSTEGYAKSLAMEIDLVEACDDPEWPLDPIVTKNALIGMLYMFGMLIGSFIFGVASDRFGRRAALVACIVLSASCTLAGAFIKNFAAYAVIRFLAGVGGKGLFMIAFMFAVEIAGSKYKMYLGILIQIPFAIGTMLVGLIAYLVQDWQKFQGLIAVIVFAMASLWFFLPESPRGALGTTSNSGKEDLGSGGKSKQYGTKDLFTGAKTAISGVSWIDRYVTRNTLIMFANWMCATLGYYGLSFNAVNLSGNIYASFVLTALIEIPSYIMTVLVIDGWGRKPLLVACQVFGGLTCIAAGFVDEDISWLITSLSLAGKFGVSASFAIVYLYTAEMYPTSMRSTAVGSCSMVARIGGILAPLLVTIRPKSVPFLVMGTSCLIGGLLAIFLPETLGALLPETMDDVRALYSNPKKWYQWLPRSELRRMRKEVLDAELKKETRHNTLEAGPSSGLDEQSSAVPNIIVMDATPIVERRVSEDPGRFSSDEDEAGKFEQINDVPNSEEDNDIYLVEDKVVVARPEFKYSTSVDEALTTLNNVLDSPNGEKKESTALHTQNEQEHLKEKRSELALNLSLAAGVAREEKPSSPIPEAPPLPMAPLTPPAELTSKLAHNKALEIQVKSRRFSQLAPVSTSSPHAVKMGSKFTMIPTEADISVSSIQEEDEE